MRYEFHSLRIEAGAEVGVLKDKPMVLYEVIYFWPQRLVGVINGRNSIRAEYILYPGDVSKDKL